MNKDYYPIYGVVLAGAALAVWAGMPVVLLLFLACPLMVLLMLKGTGVALGDPGSTPVASQAHPTVAPPEDAERP